MHVTIIDRRAVKREVKSILSTAQVNPKSMVALYLGICTLLSTCIAQLPSLTIFDLVFPTSHNAFDAIVLAGTFLSVLVALISSVLSIGFTLYCIRARNGERTEYLDLLDGFSFASSIISLLIRQFFYIWLWSMLFIIPGIVAAYRYRFAVLNLCQHQDCTAKEAMELSKAQTMGYKSQLFILDLSYLPWILLAALPLFSFNGVTIYDLLSMGVPALWVQTLIYGLWDLMISLFYLPTYQTCEVMYFEIAQESCQQKHQPKEEKEHNIWE